MDSRKIFESSINLLIVAPMQGVTDYPYRKTLEEIGGMDAFLSEYIVVSNDDSYAKREIRDVFKSWEDPDSRIPLIPQLISSSITGAIKVIKELKEMEIHSIDLNMGCPTKSAINRKCGAYQSEHPEEAYALIEAVREEVSGGLSVKTRLGNTSDKHYEDLINMLERSSCDFVTMHCRFATKGYHGEVFPEYAKKATQILSKPLVYNGGLSDVMRIDEIAKVVGARGVMLGRGVMQNPWVFYQVKEYRQTNEVPFVTKEMFINFFVSLIKNYQLQGLLEIGCLRKCKQLLAAFRHQGEGWKYFLQEAMRKNDLNDFMTWMENVPLEILSSIGQKTNTYFD